MTKREQAPLTDAERELLDAFIAIVVARAVEKKRADAADARGGDR